MSPLVRSPRDLVGSWDNVEAFIFIESTVSMSRGVRITTNRKSTREEDVRVPLDLEGIDSLIGLFGKGESKGQCLPRGAIFLKPVSLPLWSRPHEHRLDAT